MSLDCKVQTYFLEPSIKQRSLSLSIDHSTGRPKFFINIKTYKNKAQIDFDTEREEENNPHNQVNSVDCSDPINSDNPCHVRAIEITPRNYIVIPPECNSSDSEEESEVEIVQAVKSDPEVTEISEETTETTNPTVEESSENLPTASTVSPSHTDIFAPSSSDSSDESDNSVGTKKRKHYSPKCSPTCSPTSPPHSPLPEDCEQNNTPPHQPTSPPCPVAESANKRKRT